MQYCGERTRVRMVLLSRGEERFLVPSNGVTQAPLWPLKSLVLSVAPLRSSMLWSAVMLRSGCGHAARAEELWGHDPA